MTDSPTSRTACASPCLVMTETDRKFDTILDRYETKPKARRKGIVGLVERLAPSLRPFFTLVAVKEG